VIRRTYRFTIFIVALALGHTAVISFMAQAAPSNGTSIRAVQNSAGSTAIIVVTSKKYAKDPIVVTSSSLQGKSSSKTFIIGSVSVGKNGTAVVTSAIPLPEKSTLSVFSGTNHLLTVVDIPISTVTTLPKSSKATASSSSTTKKILQAAAVRWRIEFDKSRVPIDPTVLRDAVDSASAALNAYAAAGGDIKNQLVIALTSAMNARPQVLEEITTAAKAVREATTRLPARLDPVALRQAEDFALKSLNAYLAAGGSNQNELVVSLLGAIKASPPVIADITSAANAVREATTRLPAPLDPVALREAGDFAVKSINAYLAAGGSIQNELVVSLLGAMKAFPPVIADITAAANAVRVATNQLPPLVDPRQAAEEEVLRGLVVKAEALLDSYFAAGGSGEDEVALALLRALNADPQNLSNIIEAMNALSYAKTQLPAPDDLEDVLGD
jgi:hypothetical protein